MTQRRHLTVVFGSQTSIDRQVEALAAAVHPDDRSDCFFDLQATMAGGRDSGSFVINEHPLSAFAHEHQRLCEKLCDHFEQGAFVRADALLRSLDSDQRHELWRSLRAMDYGVEPTAEEPLATQVASDRLLRAQVLQQLTPAPNAGLSKAIQLVRTWMQPKPRSEPALEKPKM